MNVNLKKMQEAFKFKQVHINKIDAFSHSIIEDKNKILYANFFQNEDNINLEKRLAEETVATGNESELAFLSWIDKEWRCLNEEKFILPI